MPEFPMYDCEDMENVMVLDHPIVKELLRRIERAEAARAEERARLEDLRWIEDQVSPSMWPDHGRYALSILAAFLPTNDLHSAIVQTRKKIMAELQPAIESVRRMLAEMQQFESAPPASEAPAREGA